ncbi:long-chain fatty acid--CoA ligase [Skermanella stibiiresistens SB22]|uniref:Long-chain fatty acid--CoA ligase n=1 Tax=Skermanella stibiiresistens SB22 TaxID=1385369 RepID=W9H3J7_9PROT|nr:AMP-binding protein [Skermanella stibiiresistens]EWY40765.1 long-chain fatty acid--CoA ligase [Skermanella stibiiresistens SB22]
MSAPLTIGRMLTAHARLKPHRIGARDLERALTFKEWNDRANKLANALLGLGLRKGDRVAVLAYNCVEWAEIYGAAAKSGIVAVPINFRLVGPEIRYIVEDADASALIVQDVLAHEIEAIRDGLSIPAGNFVHFGQAAAPAGYRGYEDLIAAASDAEPSDQPGPDDAWTLMYTSGTTGNPKGAIRGHRGMSMLALMTEVELGIHGRDDALLVMPMCHANSLNFFSAFVYVGATITIFSRKSFDPELCLRIFGEMGATFTSLVPTHYGMMLEVPTSQRERFRFDRVDKLMISSAPARAETKRAVMEMFPNSGLFELYGSTEAGWVTMLHPHEQFDKLGTVGREVVGSAPILLLDDDGNEVPDGQPGELFSCGPYSFDGYWRQPEKTREAFRGDYCTVGDVALRDEDGYIRLIDRKKNIIITGGENVYPTEIEAVLAGHPSLRDVAVIGLPDLKWGERVHAVVVPRDGATIDPGALIDWCKPHLAGYKRPRSVMIAAADDLPRTATGKVQHRLLRQRIIDKGEGG